VLIQLDAAMQNKPVLLLFRCRRSVTLFYDIFDIPHAFLSLTDAKLSALKRRPVLAHPAVVSYTKTGSHARVLKMSKNLVSQLGRAAPWLPPSGYKPLPRHPVGCPSVCLSVCVSRAVTSVVGARDALNT